MITNDVWDSKVISNGAKTVGCNGSTRRNVTPKGIKDIKCHLWWEDLYKENE
jgi:hypothetical protein